MNDPVTPSPPRKKSHFLRNLILVIVVIAAAIYAFMYFGIYDEGVRAGTLVRISKKGVVFKTYEGQLNLQTFGALKGASTFAETFDFSVERSSPEIVRELETVALSGERVNLHYIKRYAKFPWRGKTKYFIVEVERAGEQPPVLD